MESFKGLAWGETSVCGVARVWTCAPKERLLSVELQPMLAHLCLSLIQFLLTAESG